MIVRVTVNKDKFTPEMVQRFKELMIKFTGKEPQVIVRK